MRDFADRGRYAGDPQRLVSPFGLGRTLLAAVARALRGRDCADLSESRAPGHRAPEVALPSASMGNVDGEAVAAWVVEQYPRRGYPGVVIGSPHGGAAHLATALRVPWLPVGFDLSVRWDGGAAQDPGAALAAGASACRELLDRDDGLAVRHVHDPVTRGPSAGRCLSLYARWTRLPQAYRAFLAEVLTPRVPVLLVLDARTWPVVPAGDRYTFQLGSPTSGLTPEDYLRLAPDVHGALRAGADLSRWRSVSAPVGQDHAEYGVDAGLRETLRSWALRNGSPLYRVEFAGPEALSAATADIHRTWLREHGKTGNRLVVECGRLLDPWQVARAGLVPYWCENAVAGAATGAECWLAGSDPFTSIDVVVEPPGWSWSTLAPLEQWHAVAAFATRRSQVDRATVGTYPFGAVAPSHATTVLRGHPYDLPVPPPIRFDDVLAGLRDSSAGAGLILSASPA